MLKKGQIYTTNELVQIFGGSIIPSMPFVNGKVPYCKFDPKINPNFPTEAWIEMGIKRKKSAEYLIQSKELIPVFQKLRKNQWKYLGKATVSNGYNEEKISKINLNPPREKVQIILRFNFIL